MSEVPLHSSSLVSHPPAHLSTTPLMYTRSSSQTRCKRSRAPRWHLVADGKHAVRAVGPSDVLRLQVPAKGHHRAGVMPSSPSAESYAQLGCGAVSLRREGASAKMQTTCPVTQRPFQPWAGANQQAGPRSFDERPGLGGRKHAPLSCVAGLVGVLAGVVVRCGAEHGEHPVDPGRSSGRQARSL